MEGTHGKQDSETASVIKVSREPAIIIHGVPDLPLDSTSDSQPEIKNDTEAQVDPRFGEWLEGRRVMKLFGDENYLGKVAKYDSESNWYNVIYEDGDQEDLDWCELEEVLLPLDITVPLKTLVIDKCKRQGEVPDYKPKVGRPRKIYATRDGSTKKTSNMVPVSVEGQGQQSNPTPGLSPSTSSEPTSGQLVTVTAEGNAQLLGSDQPRKRGRPRKDRTLPADNQSIAADNQPKKRGRPPKNRSVSGNSQSAENTPGSLALKRITMTARAEKLKRENLRAQGSSSGTQLL